MTTLYHVAPTAVRASILAHGIDPTRAPYERSSNEAGFYAFADKAEAEWYADYMSRLDEPEPFDIWAFEASIQVVADHGLTSAELETTAIFHPGTIPSPRLVRGPSTS